MNRQKMPLFMSLVRPSKESFSFYVFNLYTGFFWRRLMFFEEYKSWRRSELANSTLLFKKRSFDFQIWFTCTLWLFLKHIISTLTHWANSVKEVAAMWQIGTFFRSDLWKKKMWKFFILFFIFNKSVHSCKRLYF